MSLNFKLDEAMKNRRMFLDDLYLRLSNSGFSDIRAALQDLGYQDIISAKSNIQKAIKLLLSNPDAGNITIDGYKQEFTKDDIEYLQGLLNADQSDNIYNIYNTKRNSYQTSYNTDLKKHTKQNVALSPKSKVDIINFWDSENEPSLYEKSIDDNINQKYTFLLKDNYKDLDPSQKTTRQNALQNILDGLRYISNISINSDDKNLFIHIYRDITKLLSYESDSKFVNQTNKTLNRLATRILKPKKSLSTKVLQDTIKDLGDLQMYIYMHTYLSLKSIDNMPQSHTSLVSYIDNLIYILSRTNAIYTGHPSDIHDKLNPSAKNKVKKEAWIAEEYLDYMRLYAEYSKGIVIDNLPSRKNIASQIQKANLRRKSTALSGPSGTGKTEMAKSMLRRMIDVMVQYAQITPEDAKILKQALPYIAGNPGTTKQDFDGKIIIDGDNKIQYIESFKEIAAKYGIPSIRDEAFRMSEQVIAAQKFDLSKKPGEYIHSKNNPNPIQANATHHILTTNEGKEYGINVPDFLKREFGNIHVDYIQGEELYKLSVVSLLHKPGYIPYIGPSFFAQNGILHRLINVSQDIYNDRFIHKTKHKYKFIDQNTGLIKESTDGKALSSVVLDTARFLDIIKNRNPNDILSDDIGNTIGRNIAYFINSSSSILEDKLILIGLFSAAGLIDKTHIKYLSPELQSYDNNNMSLAESNMTGLDITNNFSFDNGDILTDIYQIIVSNPYIDDNLHDLESIHLDPFTKSIKECISYYIHSDDLSYDIVNFTNNTTIAPDKFYDSLCDWYNILSDQKFVDTRDILTSLLEIYISAGYEDSKNLKSNIIDRYDDICNTAATNMENRIIGNNDHILANLKSDIQSLIDDGDFGEDGSKKLTEALEIIRNAYDVLYDGDAAHDLYNQALHIYNDVWNYQQKSHAQLLNTINGEKSWTVTIDGVKHTRSVSQLFATTKDFKNYVEPTDEFKKGLQDIGADPDTKYILGQDIVDSDSPENLQLNGKIIQAIAKEQYNNSWFELLKDSGLVKLNGDKIDNSELTSCCASSGNWQPLSLGHFGYVLLRAIREGGDPICIGFGENWVNLRGDNEKTALRVANLPESAPQLLNTINGEKSWTVTIDGVKHTRSVSQLFATTKDFTNYIEPPETFKKGLQDIGADPDTKYILGQDIVDSDSPENLQLNWRIILRIVDTYDSIYPNKGRFEFIKDTGLFNLDGDGIHISELTSAYEPQQGWCFNLLGKSAYIFLNILSTSYEPICIILKSNSVSWEFAKKGSAMRILNLPESTTKLPNISPQRKVIFDKISPDYKNRITFTEDGYTSFRLENGDDITFGCKLATAKDLLIKPDNPKITTTRNVSNGNINSIRNIKGIDVNAQKFIEKRKDNNINEVDYFVGSKIPSGIIAKAHVEEIINMMPTKDHDGYGYSIATKELLVLLGLVELDLDGQINSKYLTGKRDYNGSWPVDSLGVYATIGLPNSQRGKDGNSCLSFVCDSSKATIIHTIQPISTPFINFLSYYNELPF